MQIIPTSIADVFILEPKVFEDARGFFMESFNQHAFYELVGANCRFVQDNHSRSAKGVLRGMHYQTQRAQGKLVRVIRGAVFDVVVDVRKESHTFGKWFGLELSEYSRKQLWIPPGLAHGFLALTDAAELLYKVTDYYAPQYEVSLAWNDPTVGIEWPLQQYGIDHPQLSVKDQQGLALSGI